MVENLTFDKPDYSSMTIDDVELLEGETFSDYCNRMEKETPYGVDLDGNAHLFPNPFHKKHPAWRETMVPKSEWNAFKKSGIGWKQNPTLLIALVIFLIAPISKVIYYLFNQPLSVVLDEMIFGIFSAVPYILLVAIFTRIIRYAQEQLIELLKPYGKDHDSIKLLFKDDLEYLKFSVNFYLKVFSMKWLILGLIGFIVYLPYGFFLSFVSYPSTAPISIPLYLRILDFTFHIGVGLLIFQLLTFIVAIFYGLFFLAGLGKDKDKLSISLYGDMLKNINRLITEAQLEKKKIYELKQRINFVGRTYYEFQRGNRKIGELLFNIAAILVFLSVSVGIIIWLLNILNLLPAGLSTNVTLFSIATTVFGFLSFGIFIFPQLQLHRFLKNFKFSLIDSFSVLLSRLEYIYFESMIDPQILEEIDSEWGEDRENLLEEIRFVKDLIKEVKSYGTWSYDFPEIMKLLLVAVSTLIPLILTLVDIPALRILNDLIGG